MSKPAASRARGVQGGADSPLTLPFARKVAQAHADVGLAQFNALQSAVGSEADQDETSKIVTRIRYAVPAITSLTLALELFLKINCFQHYGFYPKKLNHDLTSLALSLPNDSIDRMRQRYAEMRARQPHIRVATFGLTIGTVAAQTAPSRVAAADSFDTAL